MAVVLSWIIMGGWVGLMASWAVAKIDCYAVRRHRLRSIEALREDEEYYQQSMMLGGACGALHVIASAIFF